MAMLTKGTVLRIGNYTADIKDYPDWGSAPEMAETTTLANGRRTYIKALEGTDSMSFTINYDKSDMTTVEGLSGSQKIKCKFPDGGGYEFDAEVSIYVTGKAVGDVMEASITLVPNTERQFKSSVTISGSSGT